jgi:MFS family permease
MLEYYDFFIYATAAALIFPQIFFPKGDPKTAIIASLATYGVGYVARPIGAFVLGHWGDTKGRKQVLVLCMFLMGFSTVAVGLLPTYDQVGLLAPGLLVLLRLIQGFAVAGEISGASSMILEHAPFGRRGFFASFTLQGVQAGQILAAAVFLPLAHYMPRRPSTLGLAHSVPAELPRDRGRLHHPPRGRRDPGLRRRRQEGRSAEGADGPGLQDSWRDMLRVVCMALMNVIPVVATIFGAAYAVQPGYGIGFSKDVYLWIPVLGNIVAVLVIPFVGNLSDRSAASPRSSSARSASGLLSFGYLYAISIHNVPLAICMSLLMWGIVYQGYNAIFPSFYPELFPTRTRVSAMAISQNLGTLVTALLPALFATVAPPGSTNIPTDHRLDHAGHDHRRRPRRLSARETYRIHMDDLGNPERRAGRQAGDRLQTCMARAENLARTKGCGAVKNGAMTSHLKIDFVSDVSCPWCAVGLSSLEAALQRVAPEVTAELHFQPFELNPQMPPEGQDTFEHLNQKYGSSREQQAQSREAIRQRGAAVGFEFSPEGRPRVYNTFNAHRLLHWAELESPAKQAVLKKLLLKAYFTDSQNPFRPRGAGACGHRGRARCGACPRDPGQRRVRRRDPRTRAHVHRRRHPLGARDHHQRPAPDLRWPAGRGVRARVAPDCRRCAADPVRSLTWPALRRRLCAALRG